MDGWLNINKPSGIASMDAVRILQRFMPQVKKIGFVGTLDPLASGVLPVAVGGATKLVDYIVRCKKSYSFCVKWGEERSTDDELGEVLLRSNYTPSLSDIESVLSIFTGLVNQVPPNFSAVHVAGKRAYDLARSGEELNLHAREVFIESLSVVSHDMSSRSTRFLLICGKGTYVRSIARDMGRVLGCLGYVCSIRREFSGNFGLKDAVFPVTGFDPPEVLPLEFAFKNLFPKIEVTRDEADCLCLGKFVQLNSLLTVGNCVIGYAVLAGFAFMLCRVMGEVVKAIKIVKL